MTAAPQADFSGAEFLSPQVFYQPQPVVEMVAGDLQFQQPPPQQPLQTQPVLVESMQATPAKPVEFPPQNPQINPAYPSGLRHQPVRYPPQSPQVSPAEQHPGTYHRPPNMPPNFPPTVAQPTFHQYSSPTQPPETQFPQQNGPQGTYVGTTIPPLPYQPPIGTMSGIRMPGQRPEGWRTGLFDCLEDPTNACGMSALLYGLLAFTIGFQRILSRRYRTKLRNKFSLAESPAPDWVKHCFCERCALCQEYRELRQRGWDPEIGKSH
ncbi:hypothetical protein SLEP1_g47160 [Rubroshorea leprosula]|uniref:PLAC8 family protein n=1 Tax=Rubroshorea leprosula TaxID=152421 RepID=A0AAV5LRR8_9ROSI|nr:hypothetical protein SLEP1_g47160 [Rubroshorea leprosula]